MPQTYDHTTFTNDAMPPGLPRETQKTVRGAVALGWKLIVTNKNHATLIAPPPNERQTINISASKRGKTEGPTRSIREKINRYGDDSLLAEAAENPPVETDMAAALARAERAREKYEAEKAEQAEADSVRTEPRFVGAEEPLDMERHIVSEGPMVARRSASGRGYISTTTIERKWSDGSVDYACSVDGCDFTATNRRGIGGHRGAHVRAGEVEKETNSGHRHTVQIPPYEPEHVRESGPQPDRVAALAARLKALIEGDFDWSNLDEACDLLAAEALEWGREQSGSGSALASEREPLSADEVLDRVRALVDNGLYLRQQDEMAALRAERESMEESLNTALEDAQRLRGELSGLAGLLDAYREPGS